MSFVMIANSYCPKDKLYQDTTLLVECKDGKLYDKYPIPEKDGMFVTMKKASTAFGIDFPDHGLYNGDTGEITPVDNDTYKHAMEL